MLIRPGRRRGGGKIKRGADAHYPLMSTVDICNLQVEGKHVSWLAEDNAHLYLWVTNNFLADGLRVMDAWGFQYKTVITWGKDRMGLGQYFRGQTEHLLFGVKGMVPYKSVGGKRAQGKTYYFYKRGEHSQKPREFYELIEHVSAGPFIELFARNTRQGWDSRGNQVEMGRETVSQKTLDV